MGMGMEKGDELRTEGEKQKEEKTNPIARQE